MLSHSAIKIEKSSQNLTSDTGALLISKYLDACNAGQFLDSIKFDDNRIDPTYSNLFLLEFKLLNLLIGYSSQTMQARAKDDVLFTTFMDVPSQPTISRLFSRVNSGTIEDMNEMICNHIKPVIDALDVVILDGDSTNIVCHGNQENSAHNAHYNNHGFHPLIITEATTNLVLTAKLRAGNEHCANGLEDLFKFIFEKFDLEGKRVMYRADSQFGNSAHIELYEHYNMNYAVKAMKRNKTLGEEIKDIARCYFDKEPTKSIMYDKIQFSSTVYDIMDISFKAEKVAVKSDAKQGQLSLFEETEIDYQIIFSNIDMSAEDIFEFYNNRGNSENIFKELKQDFGMGMLSHTDFVQNEFEFLFSCFAYNIYKQMLSKLHMIGKNITLSLFIRNYLRFASKVVFHARSMTVKIDASYRYVTEFFELYEHV